MTETTTSTGAPRCTYINPGIRSVNHPDKPTVAPWQCVLTAGHDGGQGHAPVPICPEKTTARGTLWPCVRAAGHEGDHWPPVESRFVHKPLREMDRDSLISAASLAFGQQIDAENQLREHWLHAFGWQRQVETLAGHVLGTVKSPHGNNHTADCWTKHPHCLAFAIIGSGGLDAALSHIAGRSFKAAARATEMGEQFLDLDDPPVPTT